MSLQRMFTKIAIAFVVRQGVKTVRGQGGLRGIQKKLRSQGGTGGLDGMMGQGTGALGGVLGTFGMARSGRPSDALDPPKPRGSVSGVVQDVAQSGGHTAPEGLLNRTRRGDEVEESVAGLAIRAMIQAARADGEIDQDEHAALTEILGDGDPSDQHFVDQAVNEPVDAAALAREVPPGAEPEVYSAALMAIDPDNRDEAEFLHSLATGLGLPESDVNEIHRGLGKALLY